MQSSQTRRALSVIVLVSWGLWFGGIMALFIFVQVLFKADRAVAVQAAPRMFLAFETYQLALAAIALIATAMWRLRAPRAILTVLFALFCIASIAAIVPPIAITPKMEILRIAGQSSSAEFKTLHGRTMIFYMTETISLFVAGLLLPSVLASPERAEGSGPATAPPADAADRSPAT